MGDPIKDNPAYLKIGDAARFLGVSRRTVYRWIMSGDLPAARVGGLYFIRQSDLQARLSIALTPTERVGERSEPTLKCGYCFRLLTSDQQVGGVCAEPGCTEIICTRCQDEDSDYCARHSPTREQRVEQARQRFQRGEIKVLVLASTARLREMNFINRVEAHLSSINTLMHPQSGEIMPIKSWAEIIRHGDERAEVMHLLNRVILDTSTLNQSSLNAWLSACPPLPSGSRAMPIHIHVRVLSRIPRMLRDGYDDQSLDAEELTPWLIRLAGEDTAQPTGAPPAGASFGLVLLTSLTGWDESARAVIQGVVKPEQAFASPNRLFYLYDLEKCELIYNPKDERARRYAELFVPVLPAEELDDTILAVERELRLYDSLTLQFAVETLPYPQNQLKLAFERLAATGRYALTNVPKLGLAIVRH